jgi:hypothetical protein
MYVLTPGGAQEAVKVCAKKAKPVPATRPEVAR